jgi:DNA-binding transcriptional ArsR family regulator
MKTSALLLHPVRLRIAQALLGDRDLTTSQLGGLLADVPPATLYRQVATLLDGGVLRVVDERQLRGTVERTYRLVQEAASVDADEARGMSADEHRSGFLIFVAGLLADFDRYLDGCRDAEGHVDPVADRVGYRQAVMHLSDAEVDDLLAELGAVFARYRDTPAGEGRSRRVLSTVLLKE